jgi:hypothetical protein
MSSRTSTAQAASDKQSTNPQILNKSTSASIIRAEYEYSVVTVKRWAYILVLPDSNLHNATFLDAFSFVRSATKIALCVQL